MILADTASCSFELTDVLDGYETDFLVTAIAGMLHIFCLTSGEEVKRFSQYKLPSPDSSISLLTRPEVNGFDLVVYDPKHARATLLTLKDMNEIGDVQDLKAAVPEGEKIRLGMKLITPKSHPVSFVGYFKDGTDAREIYSFIGDLVVKFCKKAVSIALRNDSEKASEVYVPSMPGTPSTGAGEGGLLAGMASYDAAGGGGAGFDLTAL